jgi:4-amino-4-deoxy-L-arabinose transferase-like glycosyltransferase
MFLLWVILLFAFGAGGGWLIARKMSGACARLLLLAWLVLPLGLFAAWTFYDLHAMGARDSDYDQAVPLMLIFMAMMAVPWGAGMLVGMSSGRRRRKKDAATGGHTF